MKIRTKIFFGVIFYLSFFAMGFFILYRVSETVSQDVEQVVFTKNIFSVASLRQGILFEYLLNSNKIIKGQWDTSVINFDTLLQLSLSNDPKNASLIYEIRENKKKTDTLFLQIFNEEDPQTRAVLFSKILDESQAVAFGSEKIMDKNIQDLAASYKIFILTIVVFSGGLLVGILFLFYIFNKNIIKPVLRLTAWSNELANVEFISHPVTSVKTSDEVGILSSAFETMAVRLKKTHDLLEKKIMEINKEASLRNEELARVNKLLIGRELKMVELKKKIEILTVKLKKYE